jgi:nitrogen fixation protein FixH
MRNPSRAPRPLTGRMVLLCLVAFFGIVFGVNMLMMKFAIDTLPGTEVDSAYRASLAYESQISAARDQNRRNWKVDAHVERRADGAATVRLDARDGNGTPLSGLKFSGRLERPTDKRIDRAVELAESGIGIYRGSAVDVLPGQWDLVIEGEGRGGARLFLSRNRVILN